LQQSVAFFNLGTNTAALIGHRHEPAASPRRGNERASAPRLSAPGRASGNFRPY
jgi:hypothetical protein